jgi:ferritin
MISQKLQIALNDQITAELWSANLYLSMSCYMDAKGFPGFAAWLKKQAEEEHDHAYQMAGFIIRRGGEAKVDKIDVVPSGWGNPLELFQHVYEHEVHVSKLIHNLLTLATEEKDYPTQNFLWKFVEEQVEEEATAQSVVDKVKNAGQAGIYFIDSQLGQRV